LSIALLVIGAFWGLGFAPTDAKQGHSYRIIFVHVPAAFLALAGYYVMALSGACGLIWRTKLSFMVMKSAATLGLVLTFLALFSGALWGKPTWGTYWEWDARNTFMLVLFFLYLGILALQGSFEDQEMADSSCAVLSLVGTVLVPLIYKSVDWWYTLHQSATIKITGKSSIDASMAYPLIWMIVAFYISYATMLISHTRTEILHRERRARWVGNIATGKQQ
jgi:heme exporter protein C